MGGSCCSARDWDAFLIDSDDPGLTRTIVHARADAVPNPRVPRRYRALLLDAGFTDVRIEARTAVFADATTLPTLTGRAEADRVFLGVPLFAAAATRG